MIKPMPDIMRQALPVLERLLDNGYDAVFVGGCVRDAIMGQTIKDIDIATSAKPEQVIELFSRCIPTGLQHGTVTVLHGGASYEVTTYRKESAYEKHRRPSSVEFIGDLDGDLERRDLTINAMAMRANGELYDPFQGTADIENGIVRCVGNPDERFQEDALRMLRAIRFSSAFGFRIAYGTWRALIRHRELLRHIAMERVHAELDKMISGRAPETAIRLLSSSSLLMHTLSRLPVADCLQAHCNTDQGTLTGWLNELESAELRWIGLFTQPNITVQHCEETARALRLPNDQRLQLVAAASLQREMLVLSNDRLEPSLRLHWTSAVLRYGKGIAELWLQVIHNNDTHRYHQLAGALEEWLQQMPAYSVKQLDINGRQLADCLGLKPGAWTGELLQRLLLAVAMGELSNEHEKLLMQVRLWNDEGNDHEQ